MYPRLGTSSFVASNFTFGLFFLHNSATSFTVTDSFERLKISFLILSFSSINLKQRAASISGTRLFSWFPPPKSLIVPF